MSELHELHSAWERADARLHAHLAHRHSAHLEHLSEQHQARVSAMAAEMDDALLGDAAAHAAAAREAQATYGAYVMAVHGLGQGMG